MTALCVLALGCGSSGVHRDAGPYRFLRKDPGLMGIYKHLSAVRPRTASWLAAFIAEPRGYRICFGPDDPPWTVNEPSGEPLVFETGMYPFVLYDGPSGSCRRSDGETFGGALAIYNLDHAVDGLTVGHTRATKLFRAELLDKVRRGRLTSYTIKLDGEPRITYWIGNRTRPLPGGPPTVELEFSGAALDEVRVDGIEAQDLRAEVLVYEPGADPDVRLKAEHELFVRLKDGSLFEGYVRNLEDNVFTTFVRIPCALPDELFAAAAKGGVGKLRIWSEGSERAVIAEIILGARR